MKKSFVLSLIILALLAMPVFAATANYSFSLGERARIVEGGKNGMYKYLDAGNVHISGTQRWVKKNPLARTDEMRYQVVRQISLLPDSTIGIFKVQAGANSFNGYVGYNTTASSKIYLNIYRASANGYEVSGSGTLKQD